MAKDEQLRIILAGGGTGGHLFPGVAIAEEFLKREPANRVLFIGTERGLERRVLGKMGYDLRTIDIVGIRGTGLFRQICGVGKIPVSMAQSYAIVRDFDPHMVIGVGGYASGPAVITACLMGKKTAIAEQNAVPGITNRILGRFVDKIFLTFQETAKWFAEGKVVVSGNPVRSDFVKRVTRSEGEHEVFTVLIYGGSQGAAGINRAVVDSLYHLGEIQDHLKIIHQTGDRDLEMVSAAYRDFQIQAEVFPFIHDMAAVYNRADLLVCRAGATTIAEITASGKVAILIPFPFAVGDHQTLNARVLVDAGAAEMIPEKELTGENLAGAIKDLFESYEKRMRMEKYSQKLGNVTAARCIVDECMKVM